MSLQFDLHLLGWHSFEELCRTICRAVFDQTIEAYTRGPDGGRDGFLGGRLAHGGAHAANLLQCKHTSKRDAELRVSDLDPEVPKVRHHVEANRCHTYLLMTNARVSGRVAAALTDTFKAVGVEEVRVLGYDAICELLTEHKDLRAKVPRLYGLGDLTEILDERAYAQAEAVLASMHDDLARLVPVAAHGAAHTALRDHRFALLLGRPGSGKTSIAASLTIGAIDLFGTRPVKLNYLREFADRWNPKDPNQLFWLDDAFGATQYDHATADEWNRHLHSLEAMLARGGRMIVTSRDYVYAAARPSLKRGAVTLSDEAKVVIEVERFTALERRQILYNHLRLGGQPRAFLTQLEPDVLESVCDHDGFLPELARRLGHPAFTRHMMGWPTPHELRSFIARPRQYLFELLLNLDAASRGALGLVYQRGGELESPYVPGPDDNEFLTRVGTEQRAVQRALPTLEGSLLQLVTAGGRRWWRFHHPTLRDAYSDWLSGEPELLAEYLSHAPLDELTRSVTCGEMGVTNALVVPAVLHSVVAERLRKARPSGGSWEERHEYGRVVLPFLTYRVDDQFLREFVAATPEIIDDAFDVGLALEAFTRERDLARRLLDTGLAPEFYRVELVRTLSEYAVEGLDASFLTDASWLSFFNNQELQEVDRRVLADLMPRLEEVIGYALLDEPQESDGSMIGISLDGYEKRYGKRPEIRAARGRLETWSQEREQEPDDEWLRQQAATDASPPEDRPEPERSLFDDLVEHDA